MGYAPGPPAAKGAANVVAPGGSKHIAAVPAGLNPRAATTGVRRRT